MGPKATPKKMMAKAKGKTKSRNIGGCSLRGASIDADLVGDMTGAEKEVEHGQVLMLAMDEEECTIFFLKKAEKENEKEPKKEQEQDKEQDDDPVDAPSDDSRSPACTGVSLPSARRHRAATTRG